MNSFGKIKSKILHKLGESYISGNKSEMKSILKTIKENKDFKEMYLFYEEIENKHIGDKETAKIYVDSIETLLTNEKTELNNFCESLNKKLGESESISNDLYEALDVLSSRNTLSNVEQKINAKRKIINHLVEKKEIKESKEETFTSNENLLHAVLANNFNVLYNNTLDLESKNKLKQILSLNNEELGTKVKELSEALLNKVDSLLKESTESTLSEKLGKVKDEISGMSPTKYNYYRLTQLENGLN